MSVTFTLKTSGSSTTDGQSVSTASWTPEAGKAYLIFCGGNRGSGNPATTPVASGNGITWVQDEVAAFLNGTTGVKLTAFRGRAGGSPTAGATTFDFTSGGIDHQSFMWAVVQVDGEDTSGSDAAGMIQQKKKAESGSSSTPTLTFDSATSAANSILAVCLRAAANTAITGPTGFTDVAGPSVNTPSGFMRVSKLENAADDTTDWSITGSPTPHSIIQYEIKVAAAGGALRDIRYGTFGTRVRRVVRRIVGSFLFDSAMTEPEPPPGGGGELPPSSGGVATKWPPIKKGRDRRSNKRGR